jgi:hypothetical protein
MKAFVAVLFLVMSGCASKPQIVFKDYENNIGVVAYKHLPPPHTHKLEREKALLEREKASEVIREYCGGEFKVLSEGLHSEYTGTVGGVDRKDSKMHIKFRCEK